MDPMPVNPAALENLEDLAGPEGRDFLRHLIEVYLSDTETRLVAIREAHRTKDVAILATIAHRIMGSSLSVGAEALAALMRESMCESRSGVLPGADRLRACEAEFMRVKIALLAFLG